MSRRRPVVLLCTTNGVGLGHLTRTMAIADEIAGDIDVVLFTLSAAVSIPRQAGFHVEHLLSPNHPSLSADQWHDLLEARLDHLIDHHRPAVLLFDGVHPYRGLVSAIRRARGVRAIWQRRAMWKPGVGADAMRTERHFDAVIEPGEYAAEIDRGATVAARSRAHIVHPIVYRYGRTADRSTACARAGLDPQRTNILVQLGAGQINDVSSLVGIAVRSLGRHDVAICVARSELSSAPGDERVHVVRHFPISELFAAFDGAVLAAGYNSFHEALGFGLPAVFVPNSATKTDDQDARSGWASSAGVGIGWDPTNDGSMDRATDALLDVSTRTALRARLAELSPPTGAAEVARLVERGIA